MHDLVIEDASIVDGTGAPAYGGSIAVKDGKIAAMGKSVGPAKQVMRADGLVLAPGIIDTHTHYDAQITWDPFVSPSPALGVTSVVMGNCGFTIAPCRPADRNQVMRNLTHVEGMSLTALERGIDWQFETFPQYMDFLEQRGVGVNVAQFVGHSSVRTWVLRDEASSRAATDAEVVEMRRLVDEALAAGAVGFSTTSSLQHNGEHGVPMPSRLADEFEMRTLTSALKPHGRGVLMITKNADARIAFLESLCAGAGRPFIIAALLHSNVTPDAVFDDLDQIAQARTRGNKLYGAVSACPLSFEFTMHSPYVFEGLAGWRPAMEERDPQRYVALLRNAEFRAALKAEIETPTRRMFNGEWHLMHVLRVRDAANAAYEGQSIAALAARDGVHPFDWLLDLALKEDLETLFMGTLLNSDERAVGKMLSDPNALISLSDAGAHMEFFCDAGFALHVFGHWVRERKLMSIERAVQRVTSDAAQAFGIQNRGTLKVGAAADLLMFDPDTVGRGPGERVADLPGGAMRLVTAARGVYGVWVNGEQVADHSGAIPGARKAGEVMRSFNA